MPVDMGIEAPASRSSAGLAHVRECVSLQKSKAPHCRHHGKSRWSQRNDAKDRFALWRETKDMMMAYELSLHARRRRELA